MFLLFQILFSLALLAVVMGSHVLISTMESRSFLMVTPCSTFFAFFFKRGLQLTPFNASTVLIIDQDHIIGQLS